MDQFETSVRRFFDPVGRAAGMVCKTQALNRVRFENETVFLEVLFDRLRTRELSVTIGQRERTPEMVPFDLVDVLRAYGYSNLSQVSVLRGPTDEAVDEAIGILSALTQNYALELLRNNREEFLYVGAFRRWASLRYAWETNKPKSVVAAYRALISDPRYQRVRSTFGAQDLEVLENAKQLSEQT